MAHARASEAWRAGYAAALVAQGVWAAPSLPPPSPEQAPFRGIGRAPPERFRFGAGPSGKNLAGGERFDRIETFLEWCRTLGAEVEGWANADGSVSAIVYFRTKTESPFDLAQVAAAEAPGTAYIRFGYFRLEEFAPSSFTLKGGSPIIVVTNENSGVRWISMLSPMGKAENAAFLMSYVIDEDFEAQVKKDRCILKLNWMRVIK